ncbi:hypothetical protein [Flavobacterium sp. ov086]|uniref:hypothetical protein n=1 Tax=Flavobacterium sp. ov086 TaxID=1761785 RepID=UPI000B6F1A9B|nr:hypothetical protein [Flavobacterium sp. ov086]SNR33352.1 hypothetical protein SAMN04487979_103112 [Flavobacterium sp. ov086]
MPNFTIEDYKEAIRAKYEKDINNPLSCAPTSLGQAYLRDFCWQKFEGGLSQDDLMVFASFFGFEFNPLKRTLFRDHTDKFRPVGTFLKGQTDLTTREAINLTAILVDFQHRPFRKFQEKGIISYLKHPEDSIIPESSNAKEEEEDIVIEKENDKNETINSDETISNDNIKEENHIKGFADIKPDLNKEEGSKDVEQVEVLTIVSKPVTIKSTERIEKTISYLLHKLKNTAIATLLIFGLISTVIYFAFFKNDCMQWSGDHYEVVDCSSKDEGNLNEIIPLNEELLDFRKLTACDTTNCFKKDGEAFIWYTKTPDGGIDFFNDHGRHPEFNRPLRPVSHYIYNKYLKGKPCK